MCPDGEDQPSAMAQAGLCMYLFDLGVVSQCRQPDEEDFMEAPTVTTVPSIESVQ